MAIKKGVYKYNTGEKDTSGNVIFNDIYFKTCGDLVEEDENHRFATDSEKQTWNGKASTVTVTQTANGLMSVADKKKLDGVEAGANAYVHPSSHVATMIVEDANHRFATDTEKTAWNGKASTVTVTQTANGLMSAADKKKLDGVEAGANAYVHPSSHAATMIVEDTNHRFATDTEKTTWNGKANNIAVTQTANGLMTATDKKKLDGVAAGANAYVHPGSHGATMIDQDTTHRFVTDAQISLWNKSGVESMYGNSATNTYWIKYTNGRLEQGGWIDMKVHPESGSADELITFPVAFVGDVKSVRVTSNAWPIANYDDWKTGLQSGVSSATSLSSARIILLWIGDKNNNYTARCWWEAKGWWK